MSSPSDSTLHDIPLKDPIVRQAAWAYLQPAGGTFEDCDGAGMKEVFRQLRDKCAARAEKCGCLEWINDVAFEGVLRLLFPKKKRIDFCTEEEEEQEEEKDGDGVSGEKS
ncbi:hypothetical protein LINGRAHAP2_LOCUS4195 [Linum grandiflorum]